jgi:predicted nucleotidyltransferase
MKFYQKYIKKIVYSLKTLEPYKIILFGSCARNDFSEGSDIDLVVVLNKSGISSSYDEKMSNKLLVRRSIYEISKKIPIDLVVYTKSEFELINKKQTSFIHEINNTGKILYERAS